MLNKVSLILIVIILILGALLIFREPKEVIIPYDDSEERMRIEKLQNSYDSAMFVLNHTFSKIDTIVEIKEKVKKIYVDKYIHINNAGITQLDSIIRAEL